ncbi:MAG: DUF4080 domain-containing protein [Thermodesulfobacteriota bacterium]
MYVKLAAINCRYSHSCLALFHLRNALEENCKGITIEIHQFTINDSYYNTLLRLSEGDPDVVMFSAAVWNSELVKQLSLDLSRFLPDCRIVIGGPQASVLERELLSPSVTIVKGDIEGLAESFFCDLEQKNLQAVYNSDLLLALNKKGFCLPYRQEDFATHLANRNIYYESSRGCPFSCSYCLSSAEKGVLHKDLEQVEKELAVILAHGPKVVRFVDRTFNDSPKRCVAIWKFLLHRPETTLFHFEIAPDRFSEEMFELLHQVEAGRFQFEIGVQSTSEETLKRVHRQMDVEKALKNIERLAALENIHLHADLILGLPHETKSDFLQSFDDVFGSGPHYIQMGLLKILPDTLIAREASEHGIRQMRKPPYALLANHWLGHSELQELYWFGEGVERFYNNRYFPSLWNYLRATNQSPSGFFQRLLDVGQEAGLFERAATHEFLCKILLQLLADQSDGPFFREFLVFDWLRCGNRLLPEWFSPGIKESGKQLKNDLYRKLPAEIKGYYDSRSRNRFFKQTLFYTFSGEATEALGYDSGGRETVFCFLLQRENRVQRLQEVAVLDQFEMRPLIRDKSD